MKRSDPIVCVYYILNVGYDWLLDRCLDNI